MSLKVSPTGSPFKPESNDLDDFVDAPSVVYDSPVSSSKRSPGGKGGLADILRDRKYKELQGKQKTLDTMNNARKQTGKIYNDRLAEMQRQKELTKPMDDALMQIDVLSEKLNRRDSAIKVLRVRNLVSSPDGHADDMKRNVEFARDEELKVLILMDEIDSLRRVIEEKEKESERKEKTIQTMTEKQKDMFRKSERMEFQLQEKIRKLEHEKGALAAANGQKDGVIDKLRREKVNVEEELSSVRQKDRDDTEIVRKLNETIEEQQKSIQSIEEEMKRQKTDLSEKLRVIHEAEEDKMERMERFEDLQAR